MKLFEKYIELRSIRKKLGLQKIKIKNILADCRKLNILVDWRWYPATIRSHEKLKVEKDYEGLNWELTLGLTLTVCS